MYTAVVHVDGHGAPLLCTLTDMEHRFFSMPDQEHRFFSMPDQEHRCSGMTDQEHRFFSTWTRSTASSQRGPGAPLFLFDGHGAPLLLNVTWSTASSQRHMEHGVQGGVGREVYLGWCSGREAWYRHILHFRHFYSLFASPRQIQP